MSSSEPGWNAAISISTDGSSEVGQAFALRNCDAFFVATAGSRTSLEGNAKKVAEIRSAAQSFGRDIEIYTVGQVICRASQTEAEDYYRHAIIENADWGAIDGMLANKNITPQTVPAEIRRAVLDWSFTQGSC